jgi:hypothetical protein
MIMFRVVVRSLWNWRSANKKHVGGRGEKSHNIQAYRTRDIDKYWAGKQMRLEMTKMSLSARK